MRINKTELELKYLRKINDIKSTYLKPSKLSYYGKYECLDEEELHEKLDDLLIALIGELGYQEIVNQYEDAKECFWYS